MRTNEERLQQIFRRTEALRLRQRRQKQRLLDAACLTVCLLAVGALGVCIPQLMGGAGPGSISHASGAASLIGSSAALGYILMGLLSFLLGVSVTVLLVRLRRRSGRREEDGHEL